MRLLVSAARPLFWTAAVMLLLFGTLSFARALLPESSPAAQRTDIVPLGEEAEYYVVVDYVISNRDRMPQSIPAPPQGQKTLLVTVTFGNTNGPPVTVHDNAVALVDAAGQHYLPLPAGQQVLHRVLRTTLNAGERVRGAVRFVLPNGAQPIALEWCPQVSCNNPLVVPLP